ncbi:MAG: FAD-dependent oxidoreductase [Victivallaceae bacterium]|nr:FAD-dependent oxidoreductase [Victivallaceae bacterium]
MKIVIVGAGVAGFEAALAARERAPEAEITLCGRENELPYRRPALSGMVAGEDSGVQFHIRPAGFYEEKKITLKLGVEARQLDTATHKLTLSDNSVLDFDRLVLATGGHAWVPPVPGADGDNVLTLREYADLAAIRRRIENGMKSAVVIGGGVLGLELAESLIACGVTVTVIESCPSLLPRNLDAGSSSFVQSRLASCTGLTLRFGEKLLAVTPTGVETAAGPVTADAVFFAAGMRANLEPAKSAGIRCCRGIAVDRHMATSAQGVFAAGDCAEIDGICCGLYNTARDGGKAAGCNAAGGEAEFQFAAAPVRIAVFGVKIFAAGEPEGVREEHTSDAANGNWRKLFYDANGRLTGCVLVGDLREAGRYCPK